MKTVVIKIFIFSMLLSIPFNSKAYTVVSYDPIAKYNSDKTSYFVSMPEAPFTTLGTTFVFEARSKKLKFKTNTFFHDGFVFLSKDGKHLLQIQTSYDKNEETCLVNFISENGLEKSVNVFVLKRPYTAEYYTSHITDLYLKESNLIIETEKNLYVINTDSLSITKTTLNTTNINQKLVCYSKEFLNIDSLLSINQLTFDGITLKEKLAQDLQIDSANIALNLVLTISEQRIEDIQIQVFALSPIIRSEDYHQQRTELLAKINNLLKKYTPDKGAIPEGLELWIYRGNVFEVKAD